MEVTDAASLSSRPNTSHHRPSNGVVHRQSKVRGLVNQPVYFSTSLLRNRWRENRTDHVSVQQIKGPIGVSRNQLARAMRLVFKCSGFHSSRRRRSDFAMKKSRNPHVTCHVCVGQVTHTGTLVLDKNSHGNTFTVVHNVTICVLGNTKLQSAINVTMVALEVKC